MAYKLQLKRGSSGSLPTGSAGEPLFTTDTNDLYIGTGGANQRFQKYIASGTSAQFLKGDGSLDSNTYYLASNPSAYIALTALTASSPLSYNNTTGAFTISQASGSVNGFLSSTDWTTFNNKQNTLTNPVTGTGTTNYLPKWTSGSAIGNSNLINDSSGNLGLGVVPENWFSGYKVFQVNNFSIGSYLNSSVYLGHNYYTNTSGTDIYRNNGFASNYAQFNGSHAFFTAPSGTASTAISFTQAMTLTSGGNLLVNSGTDNGNRLQVTGNASFSGNGIFGNTAITAINERLNVTGNGIVIEATDGGSSMLFGHFGGTDGIIGTFTNQNLQIRTNNTTRATIDSSGNLGLGVTPSAWRNIFNAFQIGYTGTLYSLTTGTAVEQVNLASNYYQNSAGNELRIQTGFATRYQQASGEHRWSTAGTSTAGSGISFTQAMTLTGGGNLLVGTSVDSGERLFVSGNIKNTYSILRGDALEQWQGASDTAEIGINYLGYNSGTSYFRNFSVYNGKSSKVFGIVGSTGAATFSSSVTAVSLTALDVSNLFSAKFGANSSSPSWVAIGTISGVPSINGYNNAFSATTSLALQPSGGNLLVGTSTDSGEKLQVSGNTKITVSTNGTHDLTNGTIVLRGQIGAEGRFGTQSNHDLVLTSNNTTRITVKAGGVVNIANVPSSATGLSAGDIYKDASGFLKIV